VVPIVVAIIVLLVALLAFRWFERYRFTDSWRKSEFRGAALGFLIWFGGLFGHRVPPPPQAKVEFTSRSSSLPEEAADKEQ
jgi:type II secretory pathway pseudopilin PulG